ncbi:PREDICTED: uncharacterized protein LOC108549576 [Eufriesea mexicana]|uniref:uncharacterized protein LOC108549576 n=1 Tax=Eufriesea mexicana TaxID=516756 RepID=UPI00083C6D71|nr:PREDICTED: uncharacterized protein LOC108549576 [Eufriesea mexicana]
MQAAEMMRGTRAVYDLVFLVSLSIAYVHSFPLQVLPSIPGYIPVYIRHGNQPLEEINPALAEAFHEGSSLSKNIDLDNISDSSKINPEEDEVNKYNRYPVHIRQVNNRIVPNDEKDKSSIDEAVETKESKSDANVNKEKRREKQTRKIKPKPAVKVKPLTEEEKEALEKYQIDVGEDIKISNDMHDSNLHLYESSSDKSRYKSNERAFDPIIKVDEIITDESDQSNLHLPKDNSQLFADESPPPSANDEPPIKEQRLPNVLSNVQKLVASAEILKAEKERTENQSLEEKTK